MRPVNTNKPFYFTFPTKSAWHVLRLPSSFNFPTSKGSAICSENNNMHFLSQSKPSTFSKVKE